jgi:Zn finger protein HypA/HybF involved in hydrogenase expression
MQCLYCSKEFSSNNSLLNHQHRCAKNPSPKGNKFTSETAKTLASGKNFESMVALKKSKRFSNDIVFVENSSYARHNLKRRIIEEKLLEYKCICCGNIGEHNNQPLTLQLDHINGVNNDHRLENLRFLCPNCHTQQDTYAAKNILKQKNITV